MLVMIQIEVFWVVIPCDVAVRYLPQHYTTYRGTVSSQHYLLQRNQNGSKYHQLPVKIVITGTAFMAC